MKALFVWLLLIPWMMRPLVGQEVDKPLPNIVFILVDDLGWADLGCYGADLHETPHIDRFSQSAMRFTQAYAAAPVCTPTRAAILTGLHPARLHMTIWHEASADPPRGKPLLPPVTQGNLALHHTTLAEWLQSKDYETTHIGKWHLGSAGFYPELQGFDLNIGGSFWGCPPTFFYPYRGPFGSRKEMRYVPRMEGGAPGEYLTDRLTDEALKVIAQAGEKPFFLNMCYYTVHTPIEGKPDVAAKYAARIQENPNLRHRNAHYAAMVEALDENVGRLLGELERRDLAENTIVILTSDNGGFVSEYRGGQVTTNHPLRSGKGSLYEGGVRVPLMVRWPGTTSPGSVCDEPVTSCDFFPTLRQALGSPTSEHDGVSLLSLLKNPQAPLDRDALFWHYPHYYATTEPVSGVRIGDWKLLEYHRDQRTELYHLAEDMSELQNLAEAHPERTAAMRERLHAWRVAVDAQMPTVNHP